MRAASVTFRVLLALLATLLLLAVAGFLVLRSSLPQTDGELTVRGLDGQVTVVRDDNGVAHISAGSVTDAYRALGFVHAQDRLWQLEFQRLVASGRLAEAVGEPGVSTDRFIRTLGVRQAAESAWSNIADAELRRWLIAYTDGINAFLDSRTGVLPPEFLLLGHEPEHFVPADVIAWGKMMAWDLAGNWPRELTRGRLLGRLDESEIRALYPEWPEAVPVTIEGDWDDANPGLAPAEEPLLLPDNVAEILDSFDFDALLAAFMPRLSPAAGSNAWVLSGEHTASGLPLLANDPHLGLQAPSLWYLVHLQAPGLDVMGGSLPGTPAVLLGRNANIAWGLTNTGTDVQDLYIERVSPTDDGVYLTEDGYVDFTTRTEVIKVSGGEDITMTVRETRHGPVISDLQGDLGDVSGVEGDPYVLAFRWSALDATDETVGAVMRLNHAADWQSFNDALSGFSNPQQNIMYADIQGNIGFLAPGRIPIRRAGDGFAPVPGWTGEFDWDGYVPYEEAPRVYNPPSGIIVNANQQITPDDYPYLLTLEWAEPYRANRIVELLNALPQHTVASTVRIQGDQVSLYARELAAELLRLELGDPSLAALQAELFGWDGTMAADSTAPLVIAAWQREFLKLAFEERLGMQFGDWAGNRPLVILELLRGPDSACDGGCSNMAVTAFAGAADWLEQQLGADRSAWRWSELHFVEQEHAVLGSSPLAPLANLRIANGGGAYTVNAARYDLMGDATPFRQTEGPGYRAVMDLGDPAQSVFMQSTGQSGNLLSPHYRDLMQDWRDNRGLPLDLTVPETGSTLILQPGA